MKIIYIGLFGDRHIVETDSFAYKVFNTFWGCVFYGIPILVFSFIIFVACALLFPSDPYVRPHVEETPEMQKALDEIAEYHRMNPTGISQLPDESEK